MIHILGGGIQGLSIAWQLLRLGFEIELHEKDRIGKASSFVATGMLCPYTECLLEHLRLVDMMEESLDLYPTFLKELAEDTGDDVKLDKLGTLIVGIDQDDRRFLNHVIEKRGKRQAKLRFLSGEEVREKEPPLPPKVTAGIEIPGEGKVNNCKLLKVLEKVERVSDI